MAEYRDNYKYAYISTATTTQVDTGQGQLVAIIVGETAATALQILDNTTGTTTNLAELKASVAEGTYQFNVNYATGLRIVSGAGKYTVVYNPIG
jgi:hypothetical protein